MGKFPLSENMKLIWLKCCVRVCGSENAGTDTFPSQLVWPLCGDPRYPALAPHWNLSIVNIIFIAFNVFIKMFRWWKRSGWCHCFESMNASTFLKFSFKRSVGSWHYWIDGNQCMLGVVSLCSGSSIRKKIISLFSVLKCVIIGLLQCEVWWGWARLGPALHTRHDIGLIS